MVRTRVDITDAELSVMRLLWRRQLATIRELTDELYPQGSNSHYATVQKLLDRLEKKGYVQRQLEGRVNVFSPRIGRSELIGRRLRDTADKLCDGSLTPLLTHLVEASELSGDELSALRELVERLDAGQQED